MTLIEKKLKEFDKQFVSKEYDISDCTYDIHIEQIKAFITQALQEQDRESRQQIMKDLEDKICEYDTNLQQVFRIIKQDEN